MIRTILVGAGGTGSLLARPLQHYLIALAGPKHELVIIDGDHVEKKNLARQLFHPDDIESSKAERLAASMLPGVKVYPAFLDETLAREVMREQDRVILAVDNYGVRALVDKLAMEMEDITIINPGNEDWSATCQIHMRRGGKNVTPRITYMHEEIAEGIEIVPQEDDHDCAVRAVTGEEQTIAANMLAAAMTLNAMVAVTQYDAYQEEIGFHETYFDLKKAIAGGPDWRVDGDGTWA